MGPGLELIRPSVYFTLIMWPVVVALGWCTLICDIKDEGEPAHATKYPKMIFAIAALAPLVAVYKEWKALQYCIRNFLETRGGLFLFVIPVNATTYVLVRLCQTFANHLSLFLFGLSAVQAVEDGKCRDTTRGTTDWHFAWEST